MSTARDVGRSDVLRERNGGGARYGCLMFVFLRRGEGNDRENVASVINNVGKRLLCIVLLPSVLMR